MVLRQNTALTLQVSLRALALAHYFFIYINDLSYVLENSDNNLYADDTSASAADELLTEAQRKINAHLETVGKWLYANKLSANLAKTEYTIVVSAPKLRTTSFSPLIKLNGKPIKRVLKTDHPGVIIDDNYHVKSI